MNAINTQAPVPAPVSDKPAPLPEQPSQVPGWNFPAHAGARPGHVIPAHKCAPDHFGENEPASRPGHSVRFIDVDAENSARNDPKGYLDGPGPNDNRTVEQNARWEADKAQRNLTKVANPDQPLARVNESNTNVDEVLKANQRKQAQLVLDANPAGPTAPSNKVVADVEAEAAKARADKAQLDFEQSK